MLNSLDLKGNIIILQKGVYDSLPANEKLSYNEYSLAELKEKVRNDKNARFLYYKIID